MDLEIKISMRCMRYVSLTDASLKDHDYAMINYYLRFIASLISVYSLCTLFLNIQPFYDCPKDNPLSLILNSYFIKSNFGLTISNHNTRQELITAIRGNTLNFPRKPKCRECIWEQFYPHTSLWSHPGVHYTGR